ncbi:MULTISPECIES: S9 family peptidase [unclassified Pseudonocardia]|uniref:S9 family peptidase n=1 Tax=unclassified Pseudonocardia TaxID=2619320 RepID=UPI0001FFE829|nr:S9 family peptidase [Pseudonocardia sp. Ae707_Ps1]OLM16517.1 peptidase S9, prolyl oligopeptidase active site domain protein [Pseudonocardia sp. Ae707_Ps1]
MNPPETIAVEDFLRPPERTGASISPDGTRIAFLAPWKNRLNVWIEDLDPADGEVPEPRCVTADETRTVQDYRWTHDPRWMLYLQDDGGDENWHVYRIDVDDPDAAAVDLTPFPGSRVLDLVQPPARPGTAIVQLTGRVSAAIELHELDIATGELTLLSGAPETASDDGDYVKSSHHVGDGTLLVEQLNADGDIELLRSIGSGPPRRITTFDGSDLPLGLYPFEVTPDGTGLWVGSNRGTDRTRLVRVDLATGEETEVDSHPSFDLDTRALVLGHLPRPLIRHRRTGELLGVRYLGERQVIHALDPHFAEVLPQLEALSDGDPATISSDRDGRRWIVSFTHDREPGVTWLYDHATGESRLLFRPNPHLDPDALAPTTPVTITARDGLTLPSYLTLPVGVEPSALPMVLLVHGGPWVRDAWGMDRSVQVLANRGYAVLQVNFRGSSGFGKAHMKAAIGEFAGKMHDDLLDAVDWAVEQGYADPDRVGIFGGSYGGYATLVGVSFTPDRFAAAVEYVGISDLSTFMRSVPEFARPGLRMNWYRYVGDPDDPEQEADMIARSPISRADDIRTPLMVVQGANDTRVVQAESDRIVGALRSRGVDVEYLVFDDEGHFIINPENLLTMFRSAERFLAEHLGGRVHES